MMEFLFVDSRQMNRSLMKGCILDRARLVSYSTVERDERVSSILL